ncbi:response regulator transcription factor [Amycolatopsis sp. NPDC051903]|uniref:response regulator transcription factor n=1 Tax=Amycolatopsis sp. NPDC051903 TaxID=3363936 RepID=UPI00379E018D
MVSTRGTAALRRDVRALARRGLASAAFRHESAARLAAEVAADAYCFAEIDPDSAMTTGIVSSGVDRAGAPLLYRNEYGQADFLKLPAMVRTRTPAASLLAATGGDLQRSERYRELIHPAGFGDELRAVVRDGDRVWGFLHLFRRDRRAAFGPDDVAATAEVAGELVSGVRDGVLGPSAAAPVAGAPMLVVFDDADRIVESTAPAAAALADLRDPDETKQLTPEIALGLAAVARTGAPAALRTRSRCGQWLSLTASVTTAGRVALILQPAAPPPTTETWRARYGLSAGETEVVALMLAGRSTAQIAAELVISSWTVQDRFTSGFAKTGVRSRRELTALLRPAG